MTDAQLRSLIAETVAQSVTEAVAEAMGEAADQLVEQLTTPCACDLDKEATAEMGHLMGMVRDLGQGDTAKGVESMRDSLKFVPALMGLRNRLGTWVLSAAIVVVTGGLLTLIWQGFWQGLTLRLGGGK